MTIPNFRDNSEYFSDLDDEIDEGEYAFDAKEIAAANAANAKYTQPSAFDLSDSNGKKGKGNSVADMFRTLLAFILVPLDLMFGIAITIIAELISLVIDILNYALQALARNLKNFLLTIFSTMVTGVFDTLQIFLCSILAPLTGMLFCSIGSILNGVLWGINAMFVAIRESICGITKLLYTVFTSLDAVFTALYDIACSSIEMSSRIFQSGASEASNLLSNVGNKVLLNGISTKQLITNPSELGDLGDTNVSVDKSLISSGINEIENVVTELGLVTQSVEINSSTIPSTSTINGSISSVFGLLDNGISFIVQYIPYIILILSILLLTFGYYKINSKIVKRLKQKRLV